MEGADMSVLRRGGLGGQPPRRAVGPAEARLRPAGPSPLVGARPVLTSGTATPAYHDGLRGRAGLAGGGTRGARATVPGAALVVLRRMLDRYRLNAWQDAWSTVGPQWTDLI